MPEAIRRNYQYFTEATIAKLLNLGFKGPRYPLEEGVHDYVQKLPGARPAVGTLITDNKTDRTQKPGITVPSTWADSPSTASPQTTRWSVSLEPRISACFTTAAGSGIKSIAVTTRARCNPLGHNGIASLANLVQVRLSSDFCRLGCSLRKRHTLTLH